MKNLTCFLIILCTMFSFAQEHHDDERTIPEIISKIKIGENFLLPDGTTQLKFLKVLSDSRCPEGVTCVWAGEVTFMVAIISEGNSIEKTLKIGNQSLITSLNALNVYALDVFPKPKASTPINPEDYVLNIMIKNQPVEEKQ